MAINSAFCRIAASSGRVLRTSCPISRGAASIHQSEKCALYSLSVQPLQTSSSFIQPTPEAQPSPSRPMTIMSGSFQPPGPEKGATVIAFFATLTIELHWSVMSPESRHMPAPVLRIHSVTLVRPRQPEKRISLPLSRSACPIRRNSSGALVPGAT